MLCVYHKKALKEKKEMHDWEISGQFFFVNPKCYGQTDSKNSWGSSYK